MEMLSALNKDSPNMGTPAKRRTEILDEITRLGKQQKKTAGVIISAGRRSPKGGTSYGERARRIAELVSELAGLDEASLVRKSETRLQRKTRNGVSFGSAEIVGLKTRRS